MRDPLIEAATREIIHPPGAPRYEVQRDIKQKERAIEYIAGRYQNAKITSESIKLCLYSIGDNNNYLACNRDPVDKMIGWLTSMWSEEAPGDEYVGRRREELLLLLIFFFFFVVLDTTSRSLTAWVEQDFHTTILHNIIMYFNL